MGNSKCLSDEIMDMLSDEMQKEIDSEVMVGILQESGWYTVKIPRINDRRHAVDISDWLADNCKQGCYQTSGARFLFKSHSDATLFALKWA